MLLFVFVVEQFSFAEAASGKQFSVEPWVEDYIALRKHVSQSYANLEYLLQHNKISPYDLNKDTMRALQASRSDEEALKALSDFVATFKDGHFVLQKSEEQKSDAPKSTQQITATSGGESACLAMGFARKKKFDFRFKANEVKVVQNGNDEFPFLVVEHKGFRVGIIRIADFREKVYFQTCVDTWNRYAQSLKEGCDETCRERFQYEKMFDALVEKFYATLSKVRGFNIKYLIIDLMHNGGGSDWVNDITPLLTNKKILCERRGFIKHPHSVKRFSSLMGNLKKENNQDKVRLESLEAQMKVASDFCDRDLLWTQKDSKLKCSGVGYESQSFCSYDSVDLKGKSPYSGKLFFIVDKYTASAAEDIVARHQDIKSAVVVGEHTRGSGCGYTNGGIPFVLPHSKLVVKVPDCTRERIDGTNEVVGIEPDIKFDMSNIGASEFFKNLLAKIIEQNNLSKNVTP